VVRLEFCKGVGLEVSLPCELTILTHHFEQPAGAKIYRGMFPSERQFRPISLQSKRNVCELSFYPALNLSL
jgi:hypothetical protein